MVDIEVLLFEQTIKLSPKMSLKSLKNYRLGDIIMTSDKPVAYVVTDTLKTILCDYCLQKKPQLISCTDCRQMFYCNQICQQNDWSDHRLECHTLANSPHLKSATKLMIRLWLLVQNDPSIEEKIYSLPSGRSICLDDIKVNGYINEDIISLMTQMNDDSCLDKTQDLSLSDADISTKDMALLQFKVLVETFTECQIEANLVQLWTLFIKVWSNVLKIDVLDVDTDDSAYGLFVDMSSLSHSCEPNACYVSYGTRLQVRAIKAIKPNEEMTISYIDIANPKPLRQQLLKPYFIVCNCLKCQITSDTNIDYEMFDKLKANFDVMFGSTNDKVNCNLKDLLATADKLVPFYESIYDDYYPDLSLFLVKYLKITLMNVLEMDAVINRKFLDTVVDNIRITHGIDHKIFKKMPIVRNITLKQLDADTDQVLKSLKCKPPSLLKTYTLRILILFVFFIIIYNNFDVIFKSLVE